MLLSIAPYLNKLFFQDNTVLVQNHQLFAESNDYNACTFSLNSLSFIYREAKITPKKIGLFVAIWKRTTDLKTGPYELKDSFDFLVIAISTPTEKGFFLFPKERLAELGIISSDTTVGKRGMRVYPILEEGMNKQALATHQKQKPYYHRM